MQTENNFFDELKHQYKYGGMTIRLILINLAVFLIISIIEVFARLLGPTVGVHLASFLSNFFALNTNLWEFVTHPWGLFTSIFSHFGFMHLLWNMVFLYFTGRMFEQFFDQKRMLYTYLLGGLFGGLLEVMAHFVFPGLTNATGLVIGASGAVMSVLVALAFHQPQMKIMLFGIVPMRIVFLALLFIIRDIISLGMQDGTAHFAHLGGAIIGMISIQRTYSNSNIIMIAQSVGDKIAHFFKVIFRPTKTPKMKVAKKGSSTNTSQTRSKSDEEYNLEAKARQQKTDIILDKISKSGYESLSKDEKDFLFKQSKNG